MKLLTSCAIIFNLISFECLSQLVDYQVVSDLTFFNQTYLEISFQSFNQSIAVWLNPYSLNFIDKKCLSEGTATIGSSVRGTAIISMCGKSVSGIFEFNGTDYSLDFELKRNMKTREKRASQPSYVLSRIIEDLDDYAVCGNSFPDTDKVVNRYFDYYKLSDQPKINFGRAVIKLAIFIDEMLFRHRFSSNMREAKYFVAINIAYLNRQLRQKNIRKNVQFELVIVHFSVAPFYETFTWDTATYLSKFCQWVGKTKYYSDVNLIFTGTTLWYICDGGQICTRIKGMASVGVLCNPYHSCMIIEAREGFKSLKTLVHEFGHNLGAEHDGEISSNTQNCDKNNFIMSWAVGSGKTSWSECTAKSFRQFLLSLDRNKTTNHIKCLSKNAVPIDKDLVIKSNRVLKPGAILSPNKQCRMAFGPRFNYIKTDTSNLCQRLKCKDDFIIMTTWGALEGTECGTNRECFNDNCRRQSLHKSNLSVDSEIK